MTCISCITHISCLYPRGRGVLLVLGVGFVNVVFPPSPSFPSLLLSPSPFSLSFSQPLPPLLSLSFPVSDTLLHTCAPPISVFVSLLLFSFFLPCLPAFFSFHRLCKHGQHIFFVLYVYIRIYTGIYIHRRIEWTSIGSDQVVLQQLLPAIFANEVRYQVSFAHVSSIPASPRWPYRWSLPGRFHCVLSQRVWPYELHGRCIAIYLVVDWSVLHGNLCSCGRV